MLSIFVDSCPHFLSTGRVYFYDYYYNYCEYNNNYYYYEYCDYCLAAAAVSPRDLLVKMFARSPSLYLAIQTIQREPLVS